MNDLITVLRAFLQIYTICVLAWALISWLPMVSPSLAYNSTVLAIRKFLDSVVEPYIRLFRFIPPVRIGMQQLDLSALVAIIVLQFGGNLLISVLARAVGAE